jgi:hypothetical protein
VRAGKVVEVYYGFGDASQDGFVFNIQQAEGNTIFINLVSGVMKFTKAL